MPMFLRKIFAVLAGFALVVSPVLVPAVAKATTVSLAPNSTLTVNSDGASKTAVINLNSPVGTWCEVAVGSFTGAPDYKWFNSAPCTTFKVTDLPAINEVYVRVFAGGPAQDFVVYATAGAPAPTPVVKKAPTFTVPSLNQKVPGTSTMIAWTNQGADEYQLLVGSTLGGKNYGSYTIKEPSVTVYNLPQKNKRVYLKIIAKFGKQSYYRTTYFTSTNGTVVLPPIVPEVPVTPTTTIMPTTPTEPAPSGFSISAIWANDGGDKVMQNELRASNSANVLNSLWNGSMVTLFGAKNEVVNFNLILEAKDKAANNVSINFDSLTGPNNFIIKGGNASSGGLFNWNNRNIELFYIRYLEIKGLSAFMAGNYDEEQLPARWRTSDRLWSNRAAHNQSFPDIAVPIELKPTFTIEANKNQSIWSDIYIPKNAPAGVYTGAVSIKENGIVTRVIPVQLTVKNFTLPDDPSSKTMLYLGYRDINERFFGEAYPAGTDTNVAAIKSLRDKFYLLAHRHKISLVDADPNESVWIQDAPRPDMVPRLNGTLFTTANGYDGPGVGVGNGVYAIGPYGSWGWKNEGRASMWNHTNEWAEWFAANSPMTDYFLYLIDESSDYPLIEQWANWINSNPGIGSQVPSMATIWATESALNTPSLDYAVSGMTVGQTDKWQTAVNYYLNTAGKKFMMYNGGRPASGSFMIDDDGVALRELSWGQYKKGVARWFYWESTYYNNYQAGLGQTNVFKEAQTFGGNGSTDSVRGQTGWNYSNGDGVMFYPGTDKIYPNESYNVAGPLASLRLKYWRRGIQDIDYVTLAAKINPAKTQEIVNRLVPKALWEVGVDNPVDPTYRNGPVSWSDDPNVWEAARLELANIIENK